MKIENVIMILSALLAEKIEGINLDDQQSFTYFLDNAINLLRDRAKDLCAPILNEFEMSLIHEFKDISAVKELRDRTSCGLKEAADVMRQYRKDHYLDTIDKKGKAYLVAQYVIAKNCTSFSYAEAFIDSGTNWSLNK